MLDGTTAVLVSIVISLASLFLGYHLNSYLARDKISIEDVTLLARKEQLVLATLRFIMRCQNTQGLGFPIDSFGLLDDRVQATVAGGSTGTPITRGSEEAVETRLYEYRRNADIQLTLLEENHEYLSDVRDTEIAAPEISPVLRGRLIRGGLLDDGSLASQQVDVDRARGYIADQIKEMKSCRDAIMGGIKEISDWRRNAQKTGDVDILVTLLNSGDTDGLIRSEGELTIIDSTVIVNLEEEYETSTTFAPRRPAPYPPASITVERRSMKTALFSVNQGSSVPDAVKDLTARVRAGNPLTYTVVLQDIRGNSIKRNRRSQSLD